MTVVHTVLTLGVGGLERMVLALCRAGIVRGQRPVILCVEEAGPLATAAVEMGVVVHALGKPPGRHPRFTAAAETCFAEVRPAVVHTHQLGALWYVGPAAGRLGIPVVHTEHGNPFARATTWRELIKLRLLTRSAAKSARRVVGVSREIDAALGRFGTVPKSKRSVMPNGLDPTPAAGLKPRDAVRQELGIPPGAVLVGSVGRLAEVKQYDRLIRAVAGLPAVWLSLVGDGPERAKLQELAEKVGGGRVRFAGYQARPEEYLRAFDVFALTSRSEGFPVSLLEAWAAERPIVATAVGGIPDIVTNGSDGLLVPPTDDAALCAALSKLAADAGLRQQFGLAGRRTLDAKYTLDRIADRYAALYTEVCGSKG